MVLEHEHDPERVPLYRFLSPRYWPLWLGLGLVRALNTLPLRWQMAFGRGLGRIAHALSRRDRRIADINVRLCLPGLTAQERDDLVGNTSSRWLRAARTAWSGGRARAPEAAGRLRGRRAPARCTCESRGALMLSAHFTTLEMGAGPDAAGPDQHHTPRRTRWSPSFRAAIAAGTRSGRSPATACATCCKASRATCRSGMRRTSATPTRTARSCRSSGNPPPRTSRPRGWRRSRARRCCPTFRSADNRGYVVQIHAPLDNFLPTIRWRTRRFHELIEATCAIIRSSTSGRTSASSGPARTGSVPRMSIHPRYWPTWLALGILRVFEPLPFPLLVWLGRRVGGVAALLPLGFVRIARRNLEPCLPELPVAERSDPARAFPQPRRRRFRNCDQLVELRCAHPQADAPRRRRAPDRGASRGRGAILLSAHFTTLEIGARALTARVATSIMYRRRATSCSNAS